MGTTIEWATDVWNPVTGCTKISPGCAHCYAERMSKRLAGRFGYPADDPFAVTLHRNRLNQPLHWKKTRKIFVDSMGDLFHEDVPFAFIHEVFEVMDEADHHIFIILTKRPQRLYEFMNEWIPNAYGVPFVPLANVWLGVSCEDQATFLDRVPTLMQTSAAVRIISMEPLLGPIQMLDHLLGRERYWGGDAYWEPLIDQVIVGDESGPKRRPCQVGWVRDIRDQCVQAGIPFFLKQLHLDGKKVGTPELDGRRWTMEPKNALL